MQTHPHPRMQMWWYHPLQLTLVVLFYPATGTGQLALHGGCLYYSYIIVLSLGYLSNSRSEKRKLIVERFSREGLHQLQNCNYIIVAKSPWSGME